MGDIPLNPAQQEVLDLLGATPDQRPVFDRNLRVELKAELDDLLDEIDEVLETNAEDFVKSYIQKGGQ